MMNLDSVIEKLMELKGVTKQKELAVIIGISPQDFSNRKKIGTLLPVIFEWSIHERMNLNWLFGIDNNHAVTTLEQNLSYGSEKKSPQIREMVSIMADLDEETRGDLIRQAKKERKRLETERKLERLEGFHDKPKSLGAEAKSNKVKTVEP